MDWAEIPEALRGEVRDYLAVLALALPLALLLRLYATLNQSLGHPQLVTWLQLGSILIKAPLSVWMTLSWGLGMGAVGCAWATLITQAILLLIAFWLLATQSLYKPYQLWRWPGKPDWPALKAFLRLGIPSGMSILVEVTSFTLMALFVARLGVTASAAHQIAANLTGVLYMAPLSIGIAGSARASYWLGAGQAARARHAVRVSMALTTVCSVLTAGALAWFRQEVAAFYAPGPEVAAMAATLLACVAGYHLFDAQQCASVYLLRCWRITVAPLAVYGVLLWGLGLCGGYLLAYQGLGPWAAMQSPAAFWLGGGAALALTALAFHWMLWRAAARATS
jgi:MATE family multidrug resistance protein